MRQFTLYGNVYEFKIKVSFNCNFEINIYCLRIFMRTVQKREGTRHNSINYQQVFALKSNKFLLIVFHN